MSASPTQVPETGRFDWTIIRSLLPYLWHDRLRAGVALCFLVLAKLATVSVPLILQRVVDALDVDSGVTIVAVPVALLVGYGALRFASTLFRELQTSTFVWVRSNIVRRLSLRVVDHLHRLSLSFHLSRKTGAVARDIGRGTTSVATLLNYLLFNIVPTLLEVALVAGILVTQYNAGFAWIVTGTFLLYVIVTFTITQWRLKYRTEMNKLDSQASSQAIDGLLNFETVKYFGNESFELERYDGSMSEWQHAAVKSQLSLSLLNGLQGLIIAAGVTATMLVAARGVKDGTMSIGELVAVNAFLIQIFIPLGFLGTVYSILKHALADMERMFELLETDPGVVDSPGAVPIDASSPSIEFENVSFRYNEERAILNDVSFHIDAGQKVALVGPSGSGKSTIARLVFRFYDVQEGAVRIGGQDVRDVTQQSLHKAIGVVPQDTVLFNDTIEYNLRYARLDATQEEIEQAAQMAAISDFIASLPNGYQTVVGERGLKLSGGEKQRMAIARAILKRPSIMIFDEATSSLDSASEQSILQSMREVADQHTSIIIAHRLSTIVDCDKIIVIEHGVKVEEGTHEELLERDGVYAELWRIQQDSREEQSEVAAE